MVQTEDLHIKYGTTRIPFQLKYSNRKTLGITVYPDKQVTITAPNGASMQKILEKIGNRAGWISKQIRKFESYQEKLTRRNPEYVSGETFYFKGRKYRLKVQEGSIEEVNLHGKYLKVTVQKKSDEEHIAMLLMKWYRHQAKLIFAERLEKYSYILKREKIILNNLFVRRLEKRWGSCSENRNIILNLSLIQAPLQCIDYVLVHELCHLKYLNHGPKFYEMLTRYMEGWEKRKNRLQVVSLLK
jgi:predicted metal-dependent hydrolase